MAASRTRAGAGSAAGAAADFPIDIVIPWVDGNDPAWQAQRAKYAPRATGDSAAEYRFRDWGLMRYWFRSIDAFAPWVRRIYFVTCGQRPEWLNTADPRLVCVDHSDYIPADYLPTFDSNTIEIFCNRIPGLAEHFVLFNDDTFLVGPTTREDFFEGGLPKDDAVRSWASSSQTTPPTSLRTPCSVTPRSSTATSPCRRCGARTRVSS